MNKLDKFLLKLDQKTREAIKEVITLIIFGDLSGLDIKKLKGFENRYRARVGRIRIVFDQMDYGNLIQDVSFRDNNTY